MSGRGPYRGGGGGGGDRGGGGRGGGHGGGGQRQGEYSQQNVAQGQGGHGGDKGRQRSQSERRLSEHDDSRVNYGNGVNDGRGGVRGYRGGVGGGGRGRGPPPKFVATPLPSYSLKPALGWKPFDFEKKEDVILHQYHVPKGKGEAKDAMLTVPLSVNHFELENFKLPEHIYHYEIKMERIREPREGGDDKKPGKVRTSEEGRAGTSASARGRGRGQGSSGRDPPSSEVGAGGGGGPGPRRLPKPLPQIILQYLLKDIQEKYKYFGLVTDLSNNAYSIKRLETLNIPLEFIVEMGKVDQAILQETDPGKVKVTFEATVQEIDTRAMAKYLNENKTWKGFAMRPSDKTTLEQVYNAIIKSLPRFQFLAVGRSNLMRWPGFEENLGGNVVTWKGISANVAMGWKPYLCADIAHTAFLKDTKVLDAISEQRWWNGRSSRLTDLSTWDQRTRQEASSFLRNLKVTYRLDKPKVKILAGPVTEILPTPVGKTTFLWEQINKEISVSDYFQQVYQVRVDPKGPCLRLKKTNFVPAELCVIKKGQSFSRKLDDSQTTAMLTVAKKNPDVLEGEIKREITDLKASENQVAKAWGVNLSAKMLHFPAARVIGPPKLRFGEGTGDNFGKGFAEITPETGTWEIWNSNFNFLERKEVRKWGVLVLGNCKVNTDQVWTFADQIKQNGGKKGVIFPKEDPVFENMNTLNDRDNNVDVIKKTLEGKFKGCDFILCVIPSKGSSLYSHVKQAAELHVGLLTQCVVGGNVYKGQGATVQNIILKINSKLGGVNYAVMTPPEKAAMMDTADILKCPILIIGADVTHPPPGVTVRSQKGKDVQIPSFAAVTGSIDKTGMPFMMDIKAQVKAERGAAEVIQNLGEIFLSMLKTFRERTGFTPKKIIYYRDGVGEGQFPEVLHTEMLAMRGACKSLDERYQPKITFITVQKRHKTRFFYHNGNQTANPLPGTIVDKEIVHQRELDFYLCSHKGMMGTSRPTRYHVLWDDSDFSADQIQTLTYYLCYMYVRCSKSVKIPAPTYYAHWAAARAKVFAEGMEEKFDDIPALNEKMKRHEGFVKSFPMHFV